MEIESFSILDINITFLEDKQPSQFLVLSVGEWSTAPKVTSQCRGVLHWNLEAINLKVGKNQGLKAQIQYKDKSAGYLQRKPGEEIKVLGTELSKAITSNQRSEWHEEYFNFEITIGFRANIPLSPDTPERKPVTTSPRKELPQHEIIDVDEIYPDSDPPSSKNTSMTATSSKLPKSEKVNPIRRKSAADVPSRVPKKRKSLPKKKGTDPPYGGLTRGQRALCRVIYKYDQYHNYSDIAGRLGVGPYNVSSIIRNCSDNEESDWEHVTEDIRQIYEKQRNEREASKDKPLSREQRSICRIYHMYGIEKADICARIPAEEKKVTQAINNASTDNIDSDWDHVPAPIRDQYPQLAEDSDCQIRPRKRRRCKQEQVTAQDRSGSSVSQPSLPDTARTLSPIVLPKTEPSVSVIQQIRNSTAPSRFVPVESKW